VSQTIMEISVQGNNCYPRDTYWSRQKQLCHATQKEMKRRYSFSYAHHIITAHQVRRPSIQATTRNILITPHDKWMITNSACTHQVKYRCQK
jgi:hypothetical protein